MTNQNATAQQQQKLWDCIQDRIKELQEIAEKEARRARVGVRGDDDRDDKAKERLRKIIDGLLDDLEKL